MTGFDTWLFNQAPTIVVLLIAGWAIVVKGWLNTHTHIRDLKVANDEIIRQLEKRVEAAERNAALWRDIALPAVATARRAVEVAAVPAPTVPGN